MATVLSPVPARTGDDRPICPPVGALKGKRIGVRRDYWMSWEWITDEWAKLLEADGAIPVMYRSPIGKGDKEAAEGGEDYANFIHSVDAVITGLCNCGSCTLWAIHDGVGALDIGLPAVACCTEQFEPLARMLAGQRGHTNIRLAQLPFPLEGRAEAEIREIAKGNYESMLVAFGAVR